MEFIPTTISGIAHRRYCFTSMIQENAARKKKQTPPLKSVQLGVQMRLTMRQNVEEPDVECLAKVAVLVPVGGEPCEVMVPVRWNSYGSVIETGPRSRI